MKTIDIRFDSPHAVFEAGKAVTGVVQLHVEKPTKFKSIQLLLFGESKTGWSKSGGRAMNFYYGNEKYLRQKMRLFPKDEGVASVEVAAGSHVYPFSCALQSFLPSSFEGWRGYVRYYCKATLEKPWKFNKDVKRAFTVIHHLDLSPRLVVPVSAEKRVDVKSCCFGSGYVKTNLSLTKADYVPGEPVEFEITISNHSSKMVTRVWLELKQAVKYTAYQTALTEKTSGDMTKKRSFMLFDGEVNIGHKEKDCVTGATIIPSLPPSNLEGCQNIEIQYYLVATVLCGELMKLRRNITIGTIPNLLIHTSESRASMLDGNGSREMLNGNGSREMMNGNGSKEMMNGKGSRDMINGNGSREMMNGKGSRDMMNGNGSREMMNGNGSREKLNGYHSGGVNGQTSNLSVPSTPPTPVSAPPPTYEECVYGHSNIRDDDDDEYTEGDVNWAPAYPYYDYKLHMGHKYKNDLVTVMKHDVSDKSFVDDEVMTYD